MQKPNIDKDQRIVLLSDVKQLYIQNRARLFKWALMGGIVAFFVAASQRVEYFSEGTFQQAAEQSSSESLLNEVFSGFSQGTKLHTSSLMKSNRVLRPLIEKLGLQIQPISNEWRLTRWFSDIRNSLQAEKGRKISDKESFVFSNVSYEKPKTVQFYLRFIEDGSFIIYDESKKKELAKSKINAPCDFCEISFVLKETPKAIQPNIFYPFTISPWMETVGGVRSIIKISTDKENKEYLKVSVAHSSRYLASKIVNELFAQYQSYLKNEYDKIAMEQLAYLEKRQEATFDKMQLLFDQHSKYLEKNLKESALVGIDHEINQLINPYQNLSNTLLNVIFQLKWLDEVESGEGQAQVHGVTDEIFAKISHLKKKRDLIELSLCGSVRPVVEMRQNQINEVRDERLKVENLLQLIEIDGEISSVDFNPYLSDWAKKISKPQEKKDFQDYLQNYQRLLSMKEKILQESYFYGKNAPKELEGLDLIGAEQLFLNYNLLLDQSEALMRNYSQSMKQMSDSYFEISSLSSVLNDALSASIISQASDLELRLKDQEHLSEKEKERWQRELAHKKIVLLNHVEQLHQVEKLNAERIKEKMAALRKVSLDCINQEISVLNEQALDSIKEKRKMLLIEKDLLETQMDELRCIMAKTVPEKWNFEKWLKIKTDMMSKMMVTITEVVESKTISSHMHHIKSQVLDPALTPEAPISPKLYRWAFAGSFLSAFFFFLLSFVRAFIQGFPLNYERLKVLGFPLAGRISRFCDGPLSEPVSGEDLEALRNIGRFSEGAKVINLLATDGPDYSFALAENLARRNAKSMILRCDFLSKFKEEDQPGLIQYCNQEVSQVPIRKGDGFDYITAGGFTTFGTELIQSDRFKELIEKLKEKYDWIYLFCRSTHGSAESLATLKLTEKAVVTVRGQAIDALTPYIEWGYDKNHTRITFVAES